MARNDVSRRPVVTTVPEGAERQKGETTTRERGCYRVADEGRPVPRDGVGCGTVESERRGVGCHTGWSAGDLERVCIEGAERLPGNSVAVSRPSRNLTHVESLRRQANFLSQTQV